MSAGSSSDRRISPGSAALPEEDRAFLAEYRRTLPPKNGADPLGRALHGVIAEALARYTEEIPLADLIAEGNLGISEALAERDEAEPFLPGEEEALCAEAARQMDRFLAEFGRHSKNDGLLAGQVRILSKAIDELTEEQGAKPTVDELANELGVSQQKVLDILKLTGDEPKDDSE